MSLQLAAQHLAQHGRGDDKMLVHMTPKEVSGLQQLAQMHGGSLTKNPHTGLPEAGFLDSIMPTIIGGAAMVLSDGAIQPWMIGLGVGGVEAARTGNLGKGLMAGLGAYGGAGLASGLMGAGAAAEGLGAQTAANAASEASGLTGAASNQAAQQAVADKMANLTPWDKFSSGISNLGNEQGRSLAMSALGGGMGTAKTALAAAAPIVADQMVQTTTPAPNSKSAIHPFRYDPGGGYTRLNAITPAENFKGFADGGFATVGNDSAAAPNPASGPAGQLAFNNEPVMRMAEGGVAHFDGGGYTASDVANYLQANPGMSDAQIAGAMNQYHVDPSLVAKATGVNVGDVQSRYNAAAPTGGYATGASGVSNNAINQWLGANPTASDSTIYNAMQQYGVTPQQMATATGNSLTDINDRYGLAQALTQATGQGGSLFGEAAGHAANALDPQTVAWMDSHLDASGKPDPVSVQEVARITGMPVSDVQYRYDLVKHPVKTIQPIGGAGTGLGSLNTDVPANITQTTLPTNPGTNAPAGTTTPYGNKNNPGDLILNPDGSKTVVPDIPGRPYGGFSGMGEVTNAWTAGGGHTGPDNLYVPKTVEELNAKFKNTGGTQQMLDYLSGKTSENPILHPITPTGQISKDYATSVLGYPEQDKSQKMYTYDPTTKKMLRNPDFIPYNYDLKTGSKVYGKSLNQIRGDMNTLKNDADWLTYMNTNHIEPQQIADATGVSLGEVLQHIQAAQASTTNNASSSASIPNEAHGGEIHAANGGAMYASGGIGDLGSYSDGGRLLRGPGDGVSDSIPATIGKGRPARLADGEFVVPARIVSELGNGSTEAGARKLYAMMDRVQATRGKTIGKGKVATNTRADKFLPA